eukprot:352288-Chlamydomonas_euryale.AAC.4
MHGCTGLRPQQRGPHARMHRGAASSEGATCMDALGCCLTREGRMHGCAEAQPHQRRPHAWVRRGAASPERTAEMPATMSPPTAMTRSEETRPYLYTRARITSTCNAALVGTLFFGSGEPVRTWLGCGVVGGCWGARVTAAPPAPPPRTTAARHALLQAA